jgi:hypothetical protein
MVPFDRYDLATVVAVVAITLPGVLATGSWPIPLLIGVVVGNNAAYMLRRRAGVPDRSLLGRILSRL